MESLSGPIKVFYRQNRISKSTKSPHFWTKNNILFQKKRVEDPNRVLLYIREADTEVYDALMLESPDLNGLTKAVSNKWPVSNSKIWFLDSKFWFLTSWTTFWAFTFKNDQHRGENIHFWLKIFHRKCSNVTFFNDTRCNSFSRFFLENSLFLTSFL